MRVVQVGSRVEYVAVELEVGTAKSDSRKEKSLSKKGSAVGTAVSKRKEADNVTWVRRVDGAVGSGRRPEGVEVDIMIKDRICSCKLRMRPLVAFVQSIDCKLAQ